MLPTAPPAKSRKRDANKVAERRDKLVALCVAKPRSKADLCEAVGIGSRTLDGDLKVLQECTPPRLKHVGGTGGQSDPYLYGGAGLRPQDTI